MLVLTRQLCPAVFEEFVPVAETYISLLFENINIDQDRLVMKPER